jgi:hypothetical protein
MSLWNTKKLKRHEGVGVLYYRVDGAFVEHDVLLPMYDTRDQVDMSGYYYMVKGNGGYQRLRAGNPIGFIIHDFYRLKEQKDVSVEEKQKTDPVLNDYIKMMYNATVDIVENILVKKQVVQDKQEDISQEEDRQEVDQIFNTNVSLMITETVGDSKIVALDLEPSSNKDIVSHTVVLNGEGDVLFNKVDSYKEEIVDFLEQLQEVNVVAGYNVNCDLKELDYNKPSKDLSSKVVDENGQAFKLKQVVKFLFGENIQRGKHHPGEDIYYSMKIWDAYPGKYQIVVSREEFNYINLLGGGLIAKIKKQTLEDIDKKFLNKGAQPNYMLKFGKKEILFKIIEFFEDYAGFREIKKVKSRMIYLYSRYYKLVYRSGKWGLYYLSQTCCDKINCLGKKYSEFVLLDSLVIKGLSDSHSLMLNGDGSDNYFPRFCYYEAGNLFYDGGRTLNYCSKILYVYGTVCGMMKIVDYTDS